MRIKFTGERFIILKDSAILGDLHIGFSLELERAGIYGVSFAEKRIVEEVERIKKEYGVERIILLGDVKHSIKGASSLEAKLLRRLERLSPIVVKGNHDGAIEKYMKNVVTSLSFYSFVLFHGNRKEEFKKCIVAHEHPCIEVEGARIPVIVKVKNVTVIPPFNRFLSMVALTTREFSGPKSPVL